MFIGAGVRLKRHHPTARVFTFRLETNDTSVFHQLKCTLPKVQMQYVRLTGQKVVADAEPFHRSDDAFNIPCRYIICQVSNSVIALLKGVQHFSTKFCALRIHFAGWFVVAIEKPNLGVKIPAVIVEWIVNRERSIKSFDFFEILVLELHKTDDNIGYLHASIVDVVLHFYLLASRLHNTHKSVAQD